MHHLPHVRAEKFKLVRDGFTAEKMQEQIDALRPRYEADVRAVDPSAPDYETTRTAALRLVRAAWP